LLSLFKNRSDALAKFAQNVVSSLIEETLRLNGCCVEGQIGVEYMASPRAAATPAAATASRVDASA